MSVLDVVRGPQSCARSLSDAEFWRLLREELLPLRPSQYDITSVCNLTCEGCLFFSGDDYLGHQDEKDLDNIEAFFAGEAARGVRYGYFGGAEPSLAENKLLIANRHIPYGVVFTNGIKRLSAEIDYRVHVSLWGNPERSRELRGADTMTKQIRNYRNDPRAVFVFTLTARNLDDIPYIAQLCADNGLALTFNHYSPTSKYLDFIGSGAGADPYHITSTAADNLVLSADDLRRARDSIGELLQQPGLRILYEADFNQLIHDPAGLYPDAQGPGAVTRDCGVLLTSTLRHYNTDLSESRGKCCTPNIDCGTCRLYAQSFASVLVRATRQMRQAGGQQRLVKLWRLWCELFLNDDRLRMPADGRATNPISDL
ncbi:hypothetical protein [Pseudomonas asplenii]|uniref:hypothetical protein n=1 Tax=Pseudomonas asplenii TaxID=53407 RepID=UPI0022341170|nr:hypothetical protein [Pseudomonas asplenii]UZE27753.1 hypothetical protein LOY63_20675 [Pseudomonas asplenii]